HGLVLALLGDPAPLTYKLTRDGGREIDAVARHALGATGITVPFSPYGYDERQLNSPGFRLPVGRLTRSVNGGYPQYHTSADDLTLITPGALAESLGACQRIVELLEANEYYVNRNPKGEPRLGKRGLYGELGGAGPAAQEEAMLWVLNQSDGEHSLLSIAQRSGLSLTSVQAAAQALARARLLRPAGARAARRSRASA
ncbi:MAG: DUF4910 domain-containing protein, partial [Gammaproteobacteria bacterium]|nr:DUF4910 domain-containing protein [Gammaproteobacteria bacterium]